MHEFPRGTVTFLFTDVEGSTRRWEDDSPAMLQAVERHFALLDDSINAFHGVRFKIVGDAVQAAFPTALDALQAAITAQHAIEQEDWGALGPLRVRMALHTGAATPRDNDYLAPSLNRLARLIAAGTGGQILVSEATRDLLRDVLPAGIQLRPLGEHRLRDLRESERVFQVVGEGLPDDFPALRSLTNLIGNLPAELTTFVGRASDVAEIRRLVLEERVRLLTLTGPGGTGKSRLALHALAGLEPQFADGVWLVDLAPVIHADQIIRSIADVLGVRDIPGETVAAAVQTYLQGKQLVLLADNFEHLLKGATSLAHLLVTCPRLQIVATSRAPLRISGEREFAVPPLSLPEIEDASDMTDVMESEAVQLFVDRVRSVQPGFNLTNDNSATITAICRAVDGLPLAIELAAARVRLLPPEAILTRLGNRLSLLTGGSRDRPERHQTLEAAIAWSHDLLTPDEQIMFRRFAVFGGGATLDAAEAIVGSVEPRIDTFDALASLHENSLINQSGQDSKGTVHIPRFTMLQTIQEFATRELAASGESDALRQAHACYFLESARGAAPHLIGPVASDWLNHIEDDYDNLRLALDWFCEQRDATRAVLLAGALWRFWWIRGRLDEGRAQLEAALALGVTTNIAAELAEALDGAGILAETQGDYSRAEGFHRQALALSRNLEDLPGITRSLNNLGVLAFDTGDYDQATALLQESLKLARTTQDTALIATALNDLGRIAYAQEDLALAESLYRESLDLRRQRGDTKELGQSLNNLGFIARDQADHASARQYFTESLDLYRDANDSWGSAAPMLGLALSLDRVADREKAQALLSESLKIYQETGDKRNAVVALLSLADFARDAEDTDEAAMLLHAAVRDTVALHDRVGIIDALVGVAALCNARQDHTLAARFLGAIEHAIEHEYDDPDSDITMRVSAELDRARSALGEESFTRAWAAGRALSLDEAAAEAERLTAPPISASSAATYAPPLAPR
jgi:predicted ATPase/class 3 adenylate cyclase